VRGETQTFVGQLVEAANAVDPLDLDDIETANWVRDTVDVPIYGLWLASLSGETKYALLNPKAAVRLVLGTAVEAIAAWLVTPEREGYAAAWRIIDTPAGPGFETVFQRTNDDNSVDICGNAPCADCGVNTIAIREWYWLRDEIWEQAWPGTANAEIVTAEGNYLCIGCLEKRLGRELNGHDFGGAPPVRGYPRGYGIGAEGRDRATLDRPLALVRGSAQQVSSPGRH
jgi:hypothetical protein